MKDGAHDELGVGGGGKGRGRGGGDDGDLLVDAELGGSSGYARVASFDDSKWVTVLLAATALTFPAFPARPCGFGAI